MNVVEYHVLLQWLRHQFPIKEEGNIYNSINLLIQKSYDAIRS